MITSTTLLIINKFYCIYILEHLEFLPWYFRAVKLGQSYVWTTYIVNYIIKENFLKSKYMAVYRETIDGRK